MAGALMGCSPFSFYSYWYFGKIFVNLVRERRHLPYRVRCRYFQFNPNRSLAL